MRYRAERSEVTDGVDKHLTRRSITETRRGYLWSPKRNANDHRNPFHEFMREVAPGDVVLPPNCHGLQSIYLHEARARVC